MIQDILTTLFISGALAYTGYNIFRAFGNTKRKNSSCGGCSGCSTKEKCKQVDQLPYFKKIVK